MRIGSTIVLLTVITAAVFPAFRSVADEVIVMPPGVVPPHAKPNHGDGVKQVIRDALESPENVGPIRHPMLEDVIGVIRERRSVVAGSLVEELSQERPTDSEVSKIDKTMHPQAKTETKSRMRAAESLLKACRLLDKLDSKDKNQLRLIRQMRLEATKLLNQPTVNPTVP